jgi:predicted ATPase
MAIQKLEINGFRSLRQATWEPGKLNLLVGPNAGGKSNVLRCLELISQTARGNLAKTMSEGEGMVPLLWDHQPGIVRWKLRFDQVDKDTDRERDALTYVVALRGVGSGYEIIEDALGNWRAFEPNDSAGQPWIHAAQSRRRARQRRRNEAARLGANYPKDDKIRDAFKQEEPKYKPLFERRVSKIPEGIDIGESLLCQIRLAPGVKTLLLTQRMFENWLICHDVRVDRASQMRRPAVTRLKTSLSTDGGDLATVLHSLYSRHDAFRNAIDDGMRAGFGDQFVELRFPPAAAQQIQLAVKWKKSSEPHAGSELSDGTLRFLFLLTVFSHPDPPSLIAIDEPETGLNPSMLPVIAEYAQAASERTQVVLTSHSPEFLDAFTEMAPHVTVCHWEDGETLLYPLAPDAISTWLEKYRLGHLFLRGELETIALPPVEPLENGDERFADLPSEDEMMHSGDRGSQSDA